MSESTAEFVSKFEGWSSSPYMDVGGKWTIGYGSTRDPEGQPVTMWTPPVTVEQGLAMLGRDLAAAVAEVRRDVRVPLTPEEETALDDLEYNIGAGAFRSSTLLLLLNRGDYHGAAAEFDKWDHVHGQVVAGLLRRRQAETAEFAEGESAASVSTLPRTAPEPETDHN